MNVMVAPPRYKGSWLGLELIMASFFSGLDIGEEATRAGVSCDAVEQAAPPGRARKRRAEDAAHTLIVASVAVGGREVAAGVIEVNCRLHGGEHTARIGHSRMPRC